MKSNMNESGHGLSIGGFTSQLFGNFAVASIDHAMKHIVAVHPYFRYADDCVGLAKSKAEARRQAAEFVMLCERAGVTVKHSLVLAPIGSTAQRYRPHRKRRRSHAKMR
jgi:hypothetical protein